MLVAELRIGNYLRSKLTGNIFRAWAIDIVNINNEPDNIETIPISEFWLLRAGFEISSSCGNAYCLITQNGKMRLSIFKDGLVKIGTEDINLKIEYVHQLQNLYFWVTGNELNF